MKESEDKNNQLQTHLDESLSSLDKRNKELDNLMSESLKLSEDVKQSNSLLIELKNEKERNEKEIESKQDEINSLQESLKVK